VTISSERHIVENLQLRRRFYTLVLGILFVVIVVTVFVSIHSMVAIPLNRLVAAITESKTGNPITIN